MSGAPRVLITGANGYVGARLTSHLLGQGIAVHAATRRPLPPLPAFEGARPVRLDFERPSPEALEEACRAVDAVIHLAALNDQQCREDPAKALEVNTLGTYLLTRAAQKAGVRHLIYFSSIHVYGAPLRGRYTESSGTCPASHFSLTHRFAEDYVRIAGVPARTVFRLANGIGAPVLPQTNCWMLLVNDLCRQAVTTGRMVLKSHGLQLRNFVSMARVEDLVFRVLADKERGASFEVINLVGISKSVLETAREIRAIAAGVLSRDIELLVPEASPAEREEARGEELIFETRFEAGPSEAGGEFTRAVEETLRFCMNHFGALAQAGGLR